MPDSKEKREIVTGTVIEALPNTTFRVLLEGGPEIMAHLAGKMRLYRIRVFVGNKVRVELNPYSEDKGRITQRL